MTWETTLQGKLWTHQPQGRGARSIETKKGVYVIDHKPTGRFIVGSSDSVSREVDNQLGILQTGKHGTKLLHELYGKEPYLMITEIPIGSDKDIKKTINEIRESNTTDYCLLGEIKHNAYLKSSKAK